eukprot:6712669-Alexandrium_andersonii.AAC.1
MLVGSARAGGSAASRKEPASQPEARAAPKSPTVLTRIAPQPLPRQGAEGGAAARALRIPLRALL